MHQDNLAPDSQQSAVDLLVGLPAGSPVAILLVDVACEQVVFANPVAAQLAPGVALPTSTDAWSDAASLRDTHPSGTEPEPTSLLSRIARGTADPSHGVTAARPSELGEARAPMWVVSLPLSEAPGLAGHVLVVLWPCRRGQAPVDTGTHADLEFELEVREQVVLSKGLSFAVADARAEDGPLLWVNQAFTAMTGYDEADVVGRNCRFLQGPGTDPAHVKQLRDGLHGGEDVTVTLLNYRKDGSAFWNECTLTSLYDAAGERTHYVGMQSDVTARVLMAEELAQTEYRYRLLAENSSDIISLMDTDGTVVYLSPAYDRLLGLPAEDVVGRNIGIGRHPDDADEVHRVFAAAVTGTPGRVTFRTLRSDSTWAWFEALVQPLRDALTGEVIGVQASSRDISDRLAQAAELERLAMSDSLTGLANRTRLFERLRQAQERLLDEPGHVAVLMLDLDLFKLVNDSSGHHVGDQMLVAVAERLRGCVGPSDTVARTGGDEFVILLPHVDGPQQAVLVADRVLQALRQPLALPDQEVLAVRGSIGITTTADPAHPAEALFREADLALYRAKEEGRGRHAAFDDGLRRRVVARVTAERQVRQALLGDGFRLHYQPILRLADGALVGAEALIRLAGPGTDRLVAPDEFIPAAEETGLIVEIDQWVADRVMRDLADPSAGRAGPDVALNVSPRSMLDPGFADRFAATAAEHGTDLSRLLIEVTERTLMDASGSSLDSLRALRELGVRVGVDDFGTGYSSLGYLQRLPLDFVKIDRSFTAQLESSTRATTTVSAIVTLAHAHGLSVTAEGIETEAQLEVARELGCDHGQGYLIGRPAPLARTDGEDGEDGAQRR